MDKYELLDQFGRGTFGRLYRARRLSDRHLFVIKQLPFLSLSPSDQTESLNEVRVMTAIHHAHIVQYEESFLWKGQLHIVMQYAEEGDLSKVIKERGEKGEMMEEDKVWQIAIQCIAALNYLHTNRMLHRDISNNNIHTHTHTTET